MKNGKLSWNEARALLHVDDKSPIKHKCPHLFINNRYYYELSDLADYMSASRKSNCRLSHMKGKTGMQSLARTIIMFALVESQNPLKIPGKDSQDNPNKKDAKDFLSEETWYTELLEGLAEWPDFFKACRRVFKKEESSC